VTLLNVLAGQLIAAARAVQDRIIVAGTLEAAEVLAAAARTQGAVQDAAAAHGQRRKLHDVERVNDVHRLNGGHLLEQIDLLLEQPLVGERGVIVQLSHDGVHAQIASLK